VRTLDFQDHRRELGKNAYVYPVVSRRSKGLSIGVNLNPDKVCNFDCPYCQVDRTVSPAVTEVRLEQLEAELRALLGLAVSREFWDTAPFDTTSHALRRINDVAFAGDGEPTSSKHFEAAVVLAGELLAEHGLAHVKPVVLTNATLFHRPAVARGLEAIDRYRGEIWAKLDAGTEPWFHLVDGTSFPFQRILDNLRDAARVRPIVVQAMWHRWDGQAPAEAELDAWAARLADVLDAGGRLKLVQVYSVARRPASDRVQHLDHHALEAIADRVRTLNIPVEVFDGREV